MVETSIYDFCVMSSIAIEYDHITIITVVPARNVAKVVLYYLVTDHISYNFVLLLKHKMPADEPTTCWNDQSCKLCRWQKPANSHTHFFYNKTTHSHCLHGDLSHELTTNVCHTSDTGWTQRYNEQASANISKLARLVLIKYQLLEIIYAFQNIIKYRSVRLSGNQAGTVNNPIIVCQASCGYRACRMSDSS